MKFSLTRTLKIASTGLVVVAATVLAAQTPVNAVTVKLAQQNAQTDLTNLNAELTRRTDELKKSSFSLNGDTKSTSPTALGDQSKECAEGDPQTKAAIDKTNKDSAQANSDILKLSSEVKVSIGNTKQQSAAADAQYDKFKIANTQNNIMNAVCTQKDAKGELESLIGQAQQKESQASGEGQDTGNIKEMIQKIIQLVAAVSAIIASIVALVMAIQSGDYAAAAAIFLTVIGQLGVIANILLDGQGDITAIIQSFATIGG